MGGKMDRAVVASGASSKVTEIHVFLKRIQKQRIDERLAIRHT
jgi:hypothetical protein